MRFSKRDEDALRRLAEGPTNGQHVPQVKAKGKLRPFEIRRLLRPTEAQVAKACVAVLKRYGIWTIRTNAGAAKIGKDCVKGAPAGTSDRLGSIRGKLLAVEFKKPGELPRRDQIDFLAARNAEGGVAFWIDNPEQLETILDHVLAGGRVEVGHYGKVTLTDGGNDGR